MLVLVVGGRWSEVAGGSGARISASFRAIFMLFSSISVNFLPFFGKVIDFFRCVDILTLESNII